MTSYRKEKTLQSRRFLKKEKGIVRTVEFEEKNSVCHTGAILKKASVEDATAEQEACRIEHDISEQSFQKLKRWKELGHSEETNGD